MSFVPFDPDKSEITAASDDPFNQFRKDLTSLINKHSLENLGNIPDFIIADHLINCLQIFSIGVKTNNEWHNANPDAIGGVFSERIRGLNE